MCKIICIWTPSLCVKNSIDHVFSPKHVLAKLNGTAKYVEAAVAIFQRKSFSKTCEPKVTSFRLSNIY